MGRSWGGITRQCVPGRAGSAEGKGGDAAGQRRRAPHPARDRSRPVEQDLWSIALSVSFSTAFRNHADGRSDREPIATLSTVVNESLALRSPSAADHRLQHGAAFIQRTASSPESSLAIDCGARQWQVSLVASGLLARWQGASGSPEHSRLRGGPNPTLVRRHSGSTEGATLPVAKQRADSPTPLKCVTDRLPRSCCQPHRQQTTVREPEGVRTTCTCP